MFREVFLIVPKWPIAVLGYGWYVYSLICNPWVYVGCTVGIFDKSFRLHHLHPPHSIVFPEVHQRQAGKQPSWKMLIYWFKRDKKKQKKLGLYFSCPQALLTLGVVWHSFDLHWSVEEKLFLTWTCVRHNNSNLCHGYRGYYGSRWMRTRLLFRC